MRKYDYDVDFFHIKVRLEASYVLTVPAQSEEEAIREAYRASIPTDRLYDVDKTATVCGPSSNEIVRRSRKLKGN